MRPLILAAIFSSLTNTALFAERDTPGTAMNAIKQLPRGEYKRIVRIEAREGTPVPERWHIITHDPKDENGVHEYVIAGGEVVASRAISQFVESVKADDIMKESLVKVDSDKLAALAMQYAQVNNMNITSLNYVLKKEGADAAPLWNVACLDEAGKPLAVLVVSAGKGNVISHEGFTAEPSADVLAKAETQGETEADREERRRNAKKLVVRATPITPAPEKKDVLSRVGTSINRFFTGKK
jgi:hypothetical protein